MRLDQQQCCYFNILSRLQQELCSFLVSRQHVLFKALLENVKLTMNRPALDLNI